VMIARPKAILAAIFLIFINGFVLKINCFKN
jgi:hypothetical protein